VDRLGERLEVGERARLVAARLRDLGACARPFVPGAARDRGACDLEREIGDTGALERARDAHEIARLELRSLERLAVEADERRHRDDVPRVVLDDTHERARVSGAEEVQITGAHLTGGHVVLANEAEDLTLDRPEPRADAASLVEPA